MVDDWVIKTMYATKRRRKNPKLVTNPLPGMPYKIEGSSSNTKSNPSKRHRERLNAELEHLASLLPFEQSVIAKLDKLSILRLAVSYLRMKGYFLALSYDHPVAEHRLVSHLYHCPIDVSQMEGEASLHALNGFIFIVSCDGEVFSVCKTVEHYLGFHQSDILHQSVMELIHSEDREEFQRQLSWQAMLPLEHRNLTLQEVMSPAYSHLLQRCFTVRFRCLLDNTSGFITLEISGRLQFLYSHGRGRSVPMTGDGASVPGLTRQDGRSSGHRGGGGSDHRNHHHHRSYVAQNSYQSASALGLFGVCSPLGSLPSLDGSQRETSFKTKHALDLTITSMDTRAQTHFQFNAKGESKLKVYDLIHPDDLNYVAQGHAEVCKTSSVGLLAHRWLSKTGHWVWLQSRLKIVYKNNRKDHIVAIHRQLEDSEGNELYYRRNSEYKLPFPLLEPETLLSEDDAGDSSGQQHSVADSVKQSTSLQAGEKDTKTMFSDDINPPVKTLENEALRRKLWDGFPTNPPDAQESMSGDLKVVELSTRGSSCHRRFRGQLKNYLQTTRRRKPPFKANSSKLNRSGSNNGSGHRGRASADAEAGESWYSYRNLFARNPALGILGTAGTNIAARNISGTQAELRLTEYPQFQHSYSSYAYPTHSSRAYSTSYTAPREWDFDLQKRNDEECHLSAGMMQLTSDQPPVNSCVSSLAHAHHSPISGQYSAFINSSSDYNSAYEAYSAAVAAAAVVAAASGQNSHEYSSSSTSLETIPIDTHYDTGGLRVIRSPQPSGYTLGGGKSHMPHGGYPLANNAGLGSPQALSLGSKSEELSLGAFSGYQNMLSQKSEEVAYRKTDSDGDDCRLMAKLNSNSCLDQQQQHGEAEALRILKSNGRSMQPWFTHISALNQSQHLRQGDPGHIGYSTCEASTPDSTTREGSCYMHELQGNNIHSDALLQWSDFENRAICMNENRFCDTSKYQLGFAAST